MMNKALILCYQCARCKIGSATHYTLRVKWSSILDIHFLGLGTQLFVKVPRPGDSEVIFRSSSQAITCNYQSNHLKV